LSSTENQTGGRGGCLSNPWPADPPGATAALPSAISYPRAQLMIVPSTGCGPSDASVPHHHGRSSSIAPALQREPPDAVFCLDDLLAVGALRAAAEYGLGCPPTSPSSDSMTARRGPYTTPTLTTIVTDKSAIAETAVERLAYRIVGDPEVAPQKTNIGFMLEPRETVGASA